MNNQTAPEINEIQENRKETPIEKSKRQRDLLKILEYAALGCSAIGSIIAWHSKDVLFAATPLTLTLGLNLLNREQLEKLIKQQHNAAIAQIENSIGELDSEVHSMETAPLTLEPTLTENFSQLQATTQNLENNAVTNEEFEKVIERVLLLEQSLNELQETIKDGSESKEIEESKSEVSSSKTELTLDIKALQAQLERLQKQVAKLQKQHREVIKPHLQKLNRAVKQLQESDRTSS
jgi:hypothetical protein